MSATEFNLDSFLSAPSSDRIDPSDGFFSEGSEGLDGAIDGWKESDYEGAIDYRIRQLSYSSLLTLHSCPRKFQLYRLRTTHRTEESISSTITFSFGHVVGEAIANVLEGKSENEILFNMFLGWHSPSIHDHDVRLDKSLWTAIIAIQKFISLRAAGFLGEYELVQYNNRPACELSFCINFPDGFRLRGFVDAVLRHKISGKIVVLECKTTGAVTLNPATYKNSSQAIGYSIVLDHIFPELSSYEVVYLIYQTKGKEYTAIPFVKTFLQRALWIRELLLDIETVKMYESAGVYPMRGESCLSFGRECEYYNVCTLSTEYLTKKCTEEERDKTEYQISIGLEDLLETQLEKVSIEQDIDLNTDTQTEEML